ncbi:hypothetical protein HA402_013062 [Bradysia odoriphaga]|nr:hypothetical protein HA402_013062 [Bradysia odoriphaga]
MLVCSIFGASFLIYEAYRTMKENPIIESPALRKAQLWDVPFPAVTICPEIQNKLTPFALNRTNWPEFAQKMLPENMSELPESSKIFFSIVLQNVLLQRNDQDNYDILTKFSPKINVIAAGQQITFFEVNDVTLQKTITPLGACVTFNMYDEKDLLSDGIIPSTLDNLPGKKERLWSRDSGFTEGFPVENYTYPFRAFTINHGFLMRFNVSDSGQLSQFASQFTLIIHAPDELPLYYRHAVFTTTKTEKFNFIEITPHLVVAEGIENYKPHVRQCYYTHERHLKYYKTYTQNHCESECFVDYNLAECGCVPYFMPHFNDTKICGTDLVCYWAVLHKLFLPELKDDGTAHAPVDDCNCLPTCTQLTYSIQMTELVQSAGDSGNVLQIRNKFPFFTKNVRTELHSLSEFFSNIGGSLGLLLGVSMFSIVELIYFCTVRLYFHSKRSGRKRRSENFGK